MHRFIGILSFIPVFSLSANADARSVDTEKFPVQRRIVTTRLVDTVSPPMYGEDLYYGMDSTINPCDDFYQYANGGWRRVAILPASKQKDSSFRYSFGVEVAVRNVYKRLTAIIDSATSTSNQIANPTLRAVAIFYQSCLSADSLGSDPFKRLRKAVPAVDSSRREQCLQRVFQHMGAAAAQLFVEKLKQSSASTRMNVIVSSIVKEAGERIRSNIFLSEAQKTNAIRDLSRLKLRVGIPEDIVDYSALQLTLTDYHKNVQAVKSYSHQHWVKTIGTAPKDAWAYGLIRANANYIPEQHAIEIPPVWFFPPFFYNDRDEALNFASVGWVIAHEIYHSIALSVGLDMNDTSTTITSFLKFTSSLGTLDEWDTNGRRTWSEDIADLGGARAAYIAWKSTVGNGKSHGSKTSSGFTPDQLFFIAMGQLWRAKWDGKVPFDVHAAPFARVNGTVMQMPEFTKAFGCKPGDRMYLAPDKISQIW